MRASPHLRADIQGLRAVAVALVLVFHAWPEALPGGFVGVDVFFVVSGFLITGLLRRELAETGTLDLRGFYARRARRLLPAAALVSTAVALGTPLLLGPTRWLDVALDLVATSVYAQNWGLAYRAVDYVAQGAEPSPLQHTWSLAIEEQFYLAWPALLLVARRAGADLGTGLAVGALTGGSLMAGLLLTGTSSGAYFWTHTRAWELGLGGGLAVLAATPRPRTAIFGLLLVAAGVATCRLGPEFPGWRALLPTVGAAAVLSGGDSGPAARLLGRRWLGALGDRSYALYLWHWPLVVAWTAAGGATGPGALAGVTLGTLALSELSYRLVEQPLRRPGSSLFGVGVASLVPALLGLGAVAWLRDPVAAPEDPEHPGAAVLFAGAIAPEGVAPVPSAAVARTQSPGRTMKHVHVQESGAARAPSRWGREGGWPVHLIGDSHAEHWLPAFAAIAEARGWDLTVDTKGACTPFLEPGSRGAACDAWGAAVLAAVRERPQALVVYAHAAWHRVATPGDAATVAAERALWAATRATGARVLVLDDVPRWGTDPVAAWSADPTVRKPLSECLQRELVPTAAAGSEVLELNLTDLVCPDELCRPVIGNVFVWRDAYHLSIPYARSMAPELDRRIQAVLSRPAGSP